MAIGWVLLSGNPQTLGRIIERRLVVFAGGIIYYTASHLSSRCVCVNGPTSPRSARPLLRSFPSFHGRLRFACRSSDEAAICAAFCISIIFRLPEVRWCLSSFSATTTFTDLITFDYSFLIRFAIIVVNPFFLLAIF